MGQLTSLENLIAMAAEWRRAGRQFVLAAGAFDLLHPGHVRLLEQARSLGDIVVVGVESDACIQAELNSQAPSKLPRSDAPHPIVPAPERAEILAALLAVDYVFEFDNSTLDDCIRQLRPNIFVQGGFRNQLRDPTSIEAIGCKVLNIPLEPGFSTAILDQRIQQLPQ